MAKKKLDKNKLMVRIIAGVMVALMIIPTAVGLIISFKRG